MKDMGFGSDDSSGDESGLDDVENRNDGNTCPHSESSS